MIAIIRKLLAMLKVVAYSVLAIMVYSNFIGSDGVAELLRVENPSSEGLESIGLLIPKYLFMWTLGTIILEVVDNFLSIGEPLKNKH